MAETAVGAAAAPDVSGAGGQDAAGPRASGGTSATLARPGSGSVTRARAAAAPPPQRGGRAAPAARQAAPPDRSEAASPALGAIVGDRAAPSEPRHAPSAPPTDAATPAPAPRVDWLGAAGAAGAGELGVTVGQLSSADETAPVDAGALPPTHPSY